MSTGGASSRVVIPIGVEDAGAVNRIEALRAKLANELRKLQTVAQQVAIQSGQRAVLTEKVPFSIRPRDPTTGRFVSGEALTGEAKITAEFDPAKEQQEIAQNARQRRRRRRTRARLQARADAEADKRIRARIAAENQQARDENTADRMQDADRRAEIAARRRSFSRRKRARTATAQAEAATEKLRRDREMRQSRMMMGGAGVLTALTMPISGFTPLTVGFASMSGIGFGVAAGFAVLVRGSIDATRALNTFQDKLAESAISANAVSDAFKNQQMRMEARGVAQGFLATEQRLSRMKKWDDMLGKNIKTLSVMNESWGQFRGDLSDIGRNMVNTFTGGTVGGARRLAMDIGGAFSPSPIFLRPIKEYIGSLFDRGTLALAQRGPAIDEAIRNLRERDAFRSTIVSPEDFYNRIATAGLSRDPKREKQLC
jgi:hypothetical protein